jgi:hypothetical protein
MWLRNSRTLVSPLSSSAVVQQLVGNSGLFLTNSPADEVATYVSCAALPCPLPDDEEEDEEEEDCAILIG